MANLKDCYLRLLTNATRLAEHAPTRKQRARHVKIRRYIIQRMARSILREVGIPPLQRKRVGGK